MKIRWVESVRDVTLGKWCPNHSKYMEGIDTVP